MVVFNRHGWGRTLLLAAAVLAVCVGVSWGKDNPPIGRWIKQETEDKWGDVSGYGYMQFAVGEGKGENGVMAKWGLIVAYTGDNTIAVIVSPTTVGVPKFVILYGEFGTIPAGISLRDENKNTKDFFASYIPKMSGAEIYLISRESGLVEMLKNKGKFTILITLTTGQQTWNVRGNIVGGLPYFKTKESIEQEKKEEERQVRQEAERAKREEEERIEQEKRAEEAAERAKREDELAKQEAERAQVELAETKKAREFSNAGRYTEAAAEWKALIDKKRKPSYLIEYATVLIALNRNAEATDIAKELLSKESSKIDGLMLSGRIKIATRNFDDAMEIFKQVGYNNPNYAPAIYERGNIFLMQQNYDGAKAFFERALKLDSKYALAELGLAKLAKAQKNQSEYQKHLQKAKELDPENKEIQAEFSKGR